MVDELDSRTIAKFVGVFVAALVAINAIEYLFGAAREGNIVGNEYALLSGLVIFALLLALFFQQQHSP